MNLVRIITQKEIKDLTDGLVNLRYGLDKGYKILSIHLPEIKASPTQEVPRMGYDIIKGTIEDFGTEAEDYAYGGVQIAAANFKYHNANISEAVNIARKLKTENNISPAEREKILKFVYPYWEQDTYISREGWLLRTLGDSEKDNPYFDEKAGKFIVDGNSLRSRLLFEVGGFLIIEDYLKKEKKIDNIKREKYPELSVDNYYEFIHEDGCDVVSGLVRHLELHYTLSKHIVLCLKTGS
ncbi:MAG: hypothetical protein PHX96_06765 [Candidatus Nanoarchaeia archaeon]|nr:hypothetical protein [Candidatus Nanoarchaeia archaeon]